MWKIPLESKKNHRKEENGTEEMISKREEKWIP
jgi:hypothetical protein